MSSPHVLEVKVWGHGYADRYPSLPLTIVNADGHAKAHCAVTTATPSSISFEAGDEALYAKLTLPTGQADVKPLRVDGSLKKEIEFRIGDESPNEWMAWSTMRVDLKRKLSPLMEQPGMHNAWLQMWELDSNSRYWKQVPVDVSSTPHSHLALQLELAASPRPRALVTHLGAGNPHVISLPPRRPLMVLVTTAHSLSGDPSARILVGGYGPDAEGILEFLRKGSLGAVEAVLDPGSDLANRLLHAKMMDPIAATAAAYYLLRKRDWERLPQPWLNNLADWFSWIPDAHLIRDAARIQRGLNTGEAPALAARSLQQALAAGLPLFAEAKSVMTELLFYAERADLLDKAQATLIRAMLTSNKAAGLTFGFYGMSPSAPLTGEEAFEGRQHLGTERRLKAVSQEMLQLAGALAGTAIGGNLGVTRGLELAVQGVLFAVNHLGPLQRSAVAGNADKTLFLREIYEPTSRSLRPPAPPMLTVG